MQANIHESHLEDVCTLLFVSYMYFTIKRKEKKGGEEGEKEETRKRKKKKG